MEHKLKSKSEFVYRPVNHLEYGINKMLQKISSETTIKHKRVELSNQILEILNYFEIHCDDYKKSKNCFIKFENIVLNIDAKLNFNIFSKYEE